MIPIPPRSETEFVESIKEDIQWLGADWGDHLYFASDYFDQMYEAASKADPEGQGLCLRPVGGGDPGVPGNSDGTGKGDDPYRNRSVEENLGSFRGYEGRRVCRTAAKVLRAKIDMASPNINMRDPVIYRVAHMTHHNTGDKWCIYPMYDFAHPIEDAIEGITHSICTLEFEDHRPAL